MSFLSAAIASSVVRSGGKRWFRFTTISAGTTLRAVPALSVVTCSVSRYSSPWMAWPMTGCFVIDTNHSAPSATAFRPCHGRAECAATPGTRTSALMMPLQPISSARSVGSRMIARAASRSHGDSCSTRFRPFFSAGPSSAS